LTGDISNLQTHESAARAAAEFGDFKWWVNNAGIDVQLGAHEVTEEHLDRYLRVLLSGPMLGMSVAVRHFTETGGGAIVNVSSIQGLYAFPRSFIYQAAKAGVIAATRSVALDYATAGIRCNAVLPGVISSPMTMAELQPGMDAEEFLRGYGELSPMKRVGDPEEVAGAIAFLLFGESSYVNGVGLPVDGGSIARCYAYPDPIEE
jgi:NAD(P)-dependent dehydrogenase (short-subunit alcohol dehydrogenase family)